MYSAATQFSSGVAGGRLRLMPFLIATGILSLSLCVSLGVVPRLPLFPVMLGLTALAFVLWGRAQRDLLHPTCVFGALWCGCLALGSLRLLPLISDWAPRVWLCFLTPVFTFPAGLWLSRCLIKKMSPAKPRETRGCPESLPARRTLIIAGISLAIGVFVLGYEYHLIGGIPVLSDNPDAMRMQLFGVAGQGDAQFDSLFIKLIHPFVEFNKYAVFLAMLLLAQGQLRTRTMLIAGILVVVGGTFAYGSQGSRTSLVQIGVVALAIWHYVRRRVLLRHVSLAVASLFLFAALYGSLRIQKSASAPLFDRALAKANFPQGAIGDGLAFGYATATISFEVFDRLVDDLDSVQHPRDGFLFYSFHRFIPRSNIQEFAFDLYSGESITPTFLGELYADYRYLGVLLGSVLLGVAYAWVYHQMETVGSSNAIFTQGVFLQVLVFFPYVNLFSQYLTWMFDLVFMFALIQLCQVKSAYRSSDPNCHA
jgi:hypothetical protein